MLLALLATKNIKLEPIIRWSFIVVLIISETVYFVIKVYVNNVHLFLAIPVYWCAATNIVTIVALIKKNNTYIRHAVFMMIGPVISLLVTMNNIAYTMRYYMSHALIVSAIVYLMISYYKTPKDSIENKVRTFNFVLIYFFTFEMLYPLILSSFMIDVSTFIDYIYIFDSLILNIGFVVICGTIFTFTYSFVVVDHLIILFKHILIYFSRANEKYIQ
jgi:hypothetical protein